MSDHDVTEPAKGRYSGPLYQLDADQAVYDDDAKRAAVREFLTAHGVDPDRFVVGNPICVRRFDDGELWVDTWQAVAMSEDGGTLLCEHCPHCVRQERVKVPLAAAVPEFFDGPFGPVGVE